MPALQPRNTMTVPRRHLTSRPLTESQGRPTTLPTISVVDDAPLKVMIEVGRKPNGKADKRPVHIGRRVILSNGYTFVYAQRHNSWTLTKGNGDKRSYIGDNGVRAAWQHCPQIVKALGF